MIWGIRNIFLEELALRIPCYSSVSPCVSPPAPCQDRETWTHPSLREKMKLKSHTIPCPQSHLSHLLGRGIADPKDERGLEKKEFPSATHTLDPHTAG